MAMRPRKGDQFERRSILGIDGSECSRTSFEIARTIQHPDQRSADWAKRASRRCRTSRSSRCGVRTVRVSLPARLVRRERVCARRGGPDHARQQSQPENALSCAATQVEPIVGHSLRE